MSQDWDEVWDVRTRMHEDGWSAELRIPFRILRFPSGDGEQVWGFQVVRTKKANNEWSYWAPQPRSSRLPSSPGKRGLRPARPAFRRLFRPGSTYVLAQRPTDR